MTASDTIGGRSALASESVERMLGQNSGVAGVKEWAAALDLDSKTGELELQIFRLNHGTALSDSVTFQF